jgi:hypothetical protein
MVGGYSQGSQSLELRKPAGVFVPIAWLVAGPANPVSFFAFQVYGWDFNIIHFIVCLVVPLSIACAVAIFFLRGGGFGFVTLTLITVFSGYVACAATGPIYTYGLTFLSQVGLDLSYLPVASPAEALVTSGTFIRIGLFLVAIPIVPAALILRLIAFRREEKKKKQTVSTAGIL